MSVTFRCTAVRLGVLSKRNGPASFMGVFCPSPIGANVAAKANGAEEVGVADRAIMDSGRFLFIGALVEAMMGTGCEIEPREGPVSPSELESVPEGFCDAEAESMDTLLIMAVKSSSSRPPVSIAGSGSGSRAFGCVLVEAWVASSTSSLSNSSSSSGGSTSASRSAYARQLGH
jgi:hypothetical protein